MGDMHRFCSLALCTRLGCLLPPPPRQHAKHVAQTSPDSCFDGSKRIEEDCALPGDQPGAWRALHAVRGRSLASTGARGIGGF